MPFMGILLWNGITDSHVYGLDIPHKIGVALTLVQFTLLYAIQLYWFYLMLRKITRKLHKGIKSQKARNKTMELMPVN